MPGPVYEDLSEPLAKFSSGNGFNRSRLKHPERRFAKFYNLDLTKRDFTAHDLSESRFSKCRFQSVEFGPLKNVEFADCTFNSCRFQRSNHSPAVAFERVLFYLCRFKETDFSYIGIANLQVVKCCFRTAPAFLGSRIKGLLRIEGCDSWHSFFNLPDADMRTDWETSVTTDMLVKSPLMVDWAAVRTLQHIPFLQTSLVGLILLSIHIYLLRALYYFVRLPEANCEEVRKTIGNLPNIGDKLDARLTEFCQKLIPERLVESISVSVAEIMTMFLVLFVAALSHKLMGPNEIFEFSKTQWVVDQSKPAVFYDILSQRKLWGLAAVLFLYGTSLTLFSYTFVSKILFIAHLP